MVKTELDGQPESSADGVHDVDRSRVDKAVMSEKKEGAQPLPGLLVADIGKLAFRSVPELLGSSRGSLFIMADESGSLRGVSRGPLRWARAGLTLMASAMATRKMSK